MGFLGSSVLGPGCWGSYRADAGGPFLRVGSTSSAEIRRYGVTGDTPRAGAGLRLGPGRPPLGRGAVLGGVDQLPPRPEGQRPVGAVVRVSQTRCRLQEGWSLPSFVPHIPGSPPPTRSRRPRFLPAPAIGGDPDRHRDGDRVARVGTDLFHRRHPTPALPSSVDPKTWEGGDSGREIRDEGCW